jgi:hypothetical protein
MLPTKLPVLVCRQLGPTTEILAGYLIETDTGDLMLRTESTAGERSPIIMIRAAPADANLDEGLLRFRRRDPERIAYQPSDEDPIEILGVIELALTRLAWR